MSRIRRVTNQGSEPFYGMYNGRTVIWDPHPSKAKGHYELVAIDGTVPIPRNVPAALRDTVYREMEGKKGDRLILVDGVNKHVHHVDEEMILELKRFKDSKIPGRSTKGAVYDEDVIDALSASLENHSAESKRLDAEIASKKDALAQYQAQIEAAQERAKAAGVLLEKEKEEGIIKPTNRVIK